MATGSVIRLLRTAEGKSQTDFARELGVTRSYLSQVENDRKQPSLELLRLTSKRLGVPLVLLLADQETDAATNQVLGELRRILSDILAARVAEHRTNRVSGAEDHAET